MFFLFFSRRVNASFFSELKAFSSVAGNKCVNTSVSASKMYQNVAKTLPFTSIYSISYISCLPLFLDMANKDHRFCLKSPPAKTLWFFFCALPSTTLVICVFLSLLPEHWCLQHFFALLPHNGCAHKLCNVLCLLRSKREEIVQKLGRVAILKFRVLSKTEAKGAFYAASGYIPKNNFPAE